MHRYLVLDRRYKGPPRREVGGRYSSYADSAPRGYATHPKCGESIHGKKPLQLAIRRGVIAHRNAGKSSPDM